MAMRSSNDQPTNGLPGGASRQVAHGRVTLVVVESPNKVKKIQAYLGAAYDVVATVGHFRDLPRHALGVSLPEFAPTYVVEDEKRAVVARLKARARDAAEVLLATDPDREGEAIAWHVAQVLHLSRPKRVRFREITAKALQAALRATTLVDQSPVEAQETRRILDRLVGFQVSDLLKQGVGRSHAAGRVQSATLHLVVQREREREAFRPEAYWTLSARYVEGFTARYAVVNPGGELVAARLKSQGEADAIVARSRGPHRVAAVDRSTKERKPKPPFITSTLQQAASVHLGLKPEQTMGVAQSLFAEGLITYMRTDSCALSEDAVAMARAFIQADYPAALPAVAPRYKSKGHAQEAHEAIRPTSMDAPALVGDDARLYDLIRRRFLACQCKPALVDETVVRISSGDTLWRAFGAVVAFDGFLRYSAAGEDPAEGNGTDELAQSLPQLAPAQALGLSGIDVKRDVTQPPPRYSEAALIQAMEVSGIGRPSTYARTLKMLFDHRYLGEEKRRVYPVPRGRLVDELLGRAFPDLLHARYTAELEQLLDDVAEGRRRGKEVLRGWYGPFSAQLAAAGGTFAAALASRPDLVAVAKADAAEPVARPCPRCGGALLLKPGKKGKFIGCSAHPTCAYTTDADAQPHDAPCPLCGGQMDRRAGKFGPYALCTAATCDGKFDLAATTAVRCPACDAPMKDHGKWYGCSRFPGCRRTLDKKALDRAAKTGATCPQCGHLLLVRKGTKGPFLGCVGYPVCRYTAEVPAKRARGPSAKKAARGAA